MRRMLMLLAVVASAACGGGNGPTAPDPIPAAHLTFRGQMTFTCPLVCSFEGEAVNNGPGCAVNVRGISRLLNADGAEVGRAEWSLASARRINVNETFLYDGCCFSQTAVSTPGTYKTDLTWDDVRC